MSKRSTISGPTLQMMLALSEGPLHGYGIKLDVEERTEGALRLGSGTLYEAIQRLQGRGWISEVGAPTPDLERSGRRFYALTDEGRTELKAELGRLDCIVRYARDRGLIVGAKGA